MIDIMLYNSKIMIKNLNVKFEMFTLPNSCLTNVIFINLNTFKIAKNAVQISIKLKFKTVDY